MASTKLREALEDPEKVTEEDLARLSAGQSGVTQQQLSKDYITPVNVYYTAGWALLIAVGCYFGASWMYDQASSTQLPDIPMARQGVYLFSSIAIGVVILFGWMTLFTGVGLGILGTILVFDPDYSKKQVKRQQEVAAAATFEKEKEPFWWVQAKDSATVQQEFDKISLRQKILERKMEEYEAKQRKKGGVQQRREVTP